MFTQDSTTFLCSTFFASCGGVLNQMQASASHLWGAGASRSLCCGHTRDGWSSAVRDVLSHPTAGAGGELEEAQLCTRQLWTGFSCTRRHSSPAPASAGWLCSTYFGNGGSIFTMCQRLPLLEPLQMLWNHHVCWKSSKILWACGAGADTVLCFQMTSTMGTDIANSSCKLVMQATRAKLWRWGRWEGCDRFRLCTTRSKGNDWQWLGRQLEMQQEGLREKSKT